MAKDSYYATLYELINISSKKDFTRFKEVWEEAERKAKGWFSSRESPNPNVPLQNPFDKDIFQGFLHYAAMYCSGATDFARFLLEKGADVNLPDKKDHMTPLHWAAFRGNIEMVELLLRNGVDVAAVDRSGRTALYYTQDLHRDRIVDLLKRYGAQF